MRTSSTRDLVLMPLLLPIVAIGLFPLALLPLLGFIGFIVLGILIGFAAVMAELEEPQAHAQHVISHGSMPRSEQAGYNSEMDSLMRSLHAVKIVSVGLVALGAAGYILTH
jgi:flagellar biosynthesis component FlhA